MKNQSWWRLGYRMTTAVVRIARHRLLQCWFRVSRFQLREPGFGFLRQTFQERNIRKSQSLRCESCGIIRDVFARPSIPDTRHPTIKKPTSDCSVLRRGSVPVATASTMKGVES